MSELVKSMMDGTYQIKQSLNKKAVDRGKSSFVLQLVRLQWYRAPHLVSHVFLIRTLMNQIIKNNYTDDEDDTANNIEFPLPNVKAEVLKKVLEFCEHYLAEPMTEIEKPLKSQNMSDVVQKWYADFVNVEQVLLFELILAANYLDIKPLLDLTCATVASMIKGKSPEDIRATFNIKNDFSPEEEAQVREENKWCEEA